ncbi:hypothetical protein [Massilia sp. IC2-476]|uniref:hypothetical protein n=1 Tax=Massilia sp. IC2-476 TaxID=2887199 RepID=UPI001D0F7319|nr:hypothetical protein [Massilia sp. IC2-476]MCC2971335.1 hypothetical protein [Massilia sp. IC2-476]
MKSLLLALAAACPLLALADDVLPGHLVGVWGTAESLYAGTTAQSELHLLANGTGIMAGSSPPAISIADPGKINPNMRAVVGFPVRATSDGDRLSLQPAMPPERNSPTPEEARFVCRYDGGGPTLTCSVKGRPEIVMKRRSDSVEEKTAEMIRDALIQVSAYAGKASVLRPQPAR